MLHAYCVRRAPEPPPPAGLLGVDDARVRVVREGALALWVSDGEPDAAPDLARLRAHDRVVRAALATATPLPIRFGARFRDEAAARAVLRERATEFHAALERVAGRVEVGIRVQWRESDPVQQPPPLPAGPVRSGREYLEMRRRQLEARSSLRERAAQALDQVELHFADLDLPGTRTLLPEPHVAGLLAHLVHRKEIGRYRERARTAHERLGHLALSLSGPWAPYSFV